LESWIKGGEGGSQFLPAAGKPTKKEVDQTRNTGSQDNFNKKRNKPNTTNKTQQKKKTNKGETGKYEIVDGDRTTGGVKKKKAALLTGSNRGGGESERRMGGEPGVLSTAGFCRTVWLGTENIDGGAT